MDLSAFAQRGAPDDRACAPALWQPVSDGGAAFGPGCAGVAAGAVERLGFSDEDGHRARLCGSPD